MRRTTKSFSPVLLHGKFKQTKVKTKIINGSPTPVYKGLEAIECLPAIEHFYDEQGNETEMVVMKAGSETPGVWIEQGRYHSLEATDEMGVIFEAKAHKYNPDTTEQKI